MTQRILLTISTAAVLIGVYAVYAELVGPMIAAPAAAPPPIRQWQGADEPPADDRTAEIHLPHVPWAAGAKYRLRTGPAYIYADGWKQEKPDQVRLKPFAMIWTSEGDDAEPLTVVAESALLKFASEFRLGQQSPGRVVSGALGGEVRVLGPDDLSVVGWNFFFSEAALRIWSDNPVQFAFGPHQGSAGQVQVELVPRTAPSGSDLPAVEGISSIRLRRAVKMDLVVGENKTQPVKIECDGSFEYELESHIARFEENVKVVRPDGPELADSLRCDALLLLFERGPAEQAERAATSLDLNLRFRRLLAEGRPVELVSPKHSLQATMMRMIYDVQSRVAALQDDQSVHVRRQTPDADHELRCPDVTLVHDPDGRIETAVCRGAGELEVRGSGTGEVLFAAGWLEQLRLAPDPHAELDVLELRRQATFRQPVQRTALGADVIRVWLSKEGDKPAVSQIDGDATAMRPVRLLAEKQVGLVSPDLQYEGRQLEVWMDDESAAAPGEAEGLGELELTGARASDAEDRPRQPLRLSSDTLKARVTRTAAAKSPQLAELWSDGSVTLQQQRSPGGEMFALEGERLHLRNRGEGREVLHLFGKPAHIRERGFHLEGNQVHLNRQSNLAWVEGAGLLQLPVHNSFDGEQLDEPLLLDVAWARGMTFDGSAAGFEGDVTAVLGDSRMDCQRMTVTLANRVSFSDVQLEDDEIAELAKVVCREGVAFKNFEYHENKLSQIQRGKVWEFSLNHETGETVAQGPGWLVLRQRGKAKRAALAPAQSVQANQPLTSESAEWEYTRIDFAGRMIGNSKQRHTTFENRVQIVYGPVARPVDVVDPDKLPKDGGWMSSDSLQLMHRTATDDDPAYIELLAGGNVELEGQTFRARADSVSYDQSKGLYVLNAMGNHKATIWQQKRIGAKNQRVQAQRMEFIPSQNQLRFDKATGAEGL